METPKISINFQPENIFTGFTKELGRPNTSRVGLSRDVDKSLAYQRQGAIDCYN